MITILVTKMTGLKILFKLEDFVNAFRVLERDKGEYTELYIKIKNDNSSTLYITETPEEVQKLIEDALEKEEIRARTIGYTMPDGNNIIFKPA